MAVFRKIRVMISSRSVVQVFGDTSLKEVRKRLRTFLHGIRWHIPDQSKKKCKKKWDRVSKAQL